MSEQNINGCREYIALSRRQVLTGSAAVLAASLPSWLPQVSFSTASAAQAQGVTPAGVTRDIIVSVFLRGAADGLSLVVPWADPNYYPVRPNIAVPRPDSTAANKATDLDGFFGLAPGMLGIKPAYDAGNMLLVHATGSVDGSRSHFDAQRYMETGVPGSSTTTTGWLGRHLNSSPQLKPGAPLRALGIANGLQMTLAGSPLALPIPDPSNFGLSGNSATKGVRTSWIQNVYGITSDPLLSAAENTLNTIALLGAINFKGYAPANSAAYPASGFGNALKATAALIKADVGVEAVQVDIGGWDTHNNQRTTTPGGGSLANAMTDLANSLGAFHADVIAGSNFNVTLVAVSEFGRNVRENSSQGTDHGHGNAMFAMGKNIKGGQVLRIWPGLDTAHLYQNQDLQITIDHRDILSEVVQNRLGNTNLSYVFPDFQPTFRNITK